MNGKILVIFLVGMFFLTAHSSIALNVNNSRIYKYNNSNTLVLSNYLSHADELHVFNDSIGDVMDENLVYHPEIKDIDMTQIVYTKTGIKLTLDINLVDDINKLSNITLAIIIALYTSEVEYQILYLWEQPTDTVIAYAGEQEIDVDIQGFNTNKITLTFDLINATEVYDDIIVSFSKSDTEGTYLYTDLYPNEDIELLDVDAEVVRKCGKTVYFSGSASGGTPPYSWEWYFDEDQIVDSTDQNPKYRFKEAGMYEVELNVYDSKNGVGIDYVTVTIPRNRTNIDSYWLRFIDIFPILKKILLIFN